MTDNHKTLLRIIALSISQCKILRNEMLEYSKSENKTHRSNVLVSFLRRIFTNLYSVSILSRESIKHGDSTILKLPMGLVLRNCFMDSLYAIFLSSLDNDRFEEEVKVLNKDYAYSLPSRKEVWVDKARELGVGDGLEYWYDDMIVDNFDQYLKEYSIDSSFNWNFEFYKNSDIRESKINRGISIDKESRNLMNNEKYGSVVRNVFSYYKYFSQYEHFSEHSHGDTLVSYSEDNVSFPSAINSLIIATNLIVGEVHTLG